jgi:16S rRNA C1402 (ribose-2'-O) methylase RsmI
VILLSPPEKNNQFSLEVVDQEIKFNLNKMKPKDLVEMVADNFGINKKAAYQRMLKIIKDEKK